MGKRSIERGNQDHWTIHPDIVNVVKKAVANDPEAKKYMESSRGSIPAKYFEMFRARESVESS
jgi:hypothetical protein